MRVLGYKWMVVAMFLPFCVYGESFSKIPWVGDGRAEPPDTAAFYDIRPAAEFSSVFVAPKGARTLKLRIAAAGYYRLAVNGRAPDESAGLSLMPLWSPTRETVYADDYELSPGIFRPWPQTNEVTVTLGNGFRNLAPLLFWGRLSFRQNLDSGAPVFKLTVGDVPLGNWMWRETSILRNSVYLGTEIDATFVPGPWRPAVPCTGPSGRIVSRSAPPIGIFERRRGSATWLREGAVQVVDFGVNGTGVPAFRFKGRRGQRIEIVYGELLAKDGSVNVLTQTAGQIKSPGCGGPGAPDIAAQRDVYVCSGAEEGELFVPPFTWHCCRYAEVRGYGTLLGAGDAEFRLTSSRVKDVKPGTGFLSGNADLDRLHEVCRRTFLVNLMGVQSDCPGRERLGYGGDIVSTYEAYMLNFDMREFYLKTLQDFADEAAADGWITETAPYVGVGDRAFGGRSGPISWTLVVPELMDGLLRHYGEMRALDYYPVCTRYIGLVDGRCPDGLIPDCIGDHEALERAPNGCTATAHWHRFVSLTASFARRLGKTEEAHAFDALAAKIKAAFVKKYVKDGIVANGTQSAQAIALYLGLVPQEQRARAFSRLVEAVEEKGCAPHTGIFSTRYMLLYLSENGRVDLARRIVLHKGFPGWLHMLDRGATTLWERWKESDNVYSGCHPMFGSVDEWILKYSR